MATERKGQGVGAKKNGVWATSVICAAARLLNTPVSANGARELERAGAAVEELIGAARESRAEIQRLRDVMFRTYSAAANGATSERVHELIEAERDAYESGYSLTRLDAAIAKVTGASA